MPSPAGVLSPTQYARLRGEVEGLLRAGRLEAETLVGQVLATTYWQVGRRIVKAKLTDQAAYGDGVLEALARDLELPVRTLQQAVRFGRLYRSAPKAGLSWSHYRELIGVGEDEARAFYERKALSDGWPTRQLVQEIRDDGFTLARGEGKAKAKLKRPKDANYLYRCEVERVIDGDTLVVLIDLGFDVIRRQHVRLVHVEAQEKGTKGGEAATAFVRGRLAGAQTVVVKTARDTDARGRFLAHLFYSGKRQGADAVLRSGTYLNAELLAKGLATLQWDPSVRGAS